MFSSGENKTQQYSSTNKEWFEYVTHIEKVTDKVLIIITLAMLQIASCDLWRLVIATVFFYPLSP